MSKKSKRNKRAQSGNAASELESSVAIAEMTEVASGPAEPDSQVAAADLHASGGPSELASLSTDPLTMTDPVAEVDTGLTSAPAAPTTAKRKSKRETKAAAATPLTAVAPAVAVPSVSFAVSETEDAPRELSPSDGSAEEVAAQTVTAKKTTKPKKGKRADAVVNAAHGDDSPRVDVEPAATADGAMPIDERVGAVAEAAALRNTPSDPTPVDALPVSDASNEVQGTPPAVAADSVDTATLDEIAAPDRDILAAAAHASETQVRDDIDDELVDGAVIDDALLDDGDGPSLPSAAAAMDPTQLSQLIEALVFASDKPVTTQRIRQITRIADINRIEAAIRLVVERCKTSGGLELSVVSGGYQFRTKTEFSPWVQQLIAGRPVRLSRAQLETLAIVAYRQPITRPEIDEIRGVDSGGTLKVLLDRQLIRVLGKKEEVGRPVLYGTTKEFLDFFSLNDLRELPTLREYSELTDESRSVMKKMGLDAEGFAAMATASDASEYVAPSDGASDAESDRAAAPDDVFADPLTGFGDPDAQLDAGAAGAPESALDEAEFGGMMAEEEVLLDATVSDSNDNDEALPSWVVAVDTSLELENEPAGLEAVSAATVEVDADGEWVTSDGQAVGDEPTDEV